jgi:hypothetical protein
MRTLQSKAIVSTLLAFASLGAQEATAAPLCEIVSCANGCYGTVSKASDVPPEMNQTTESNLTCGDSEINAATNGEYLGFKIPLNVAPKPLALDCSATVGGVVCEAWPQGESVTYSWSTTGSFTIDNSSGSANAVRGFSCARGTQGTITLKAFSPAGASNSLTQTVTCPSTP